MEFQLSVSVFIYDDRKHEKNTTTVADLLTLWRVLDSTRFIYSLVRRLSSSKNTCTIRGRTEIRTQRKYEHKRT